MGEHIGAMETYARLAMKAQSQCRSTIETLAEMKNPPVVGNRGLLRELGLHPLPLAEPWPRGSSCALCCTAYPKTLTVSY